MRNNLHGLRQVVPGPLLADDLIVNLPGRDVAARRNVQVKKPLVIADVQVGFCTRRRDEALAVFVRPHGSGINVDVRIEFYGSDPVSAP